MMLKSVPRDQWGEVRIKSAAIEGLEKRKPQYGLQRRWYGDYLDMVSYILSGVLENCQNFPRLGLNLGVR